MSEVSILIGGRTFKVACAPGEEAHINGLGRMIDEKVRTLGLEGRSEAQMLLFASLVLADELHEAKKGGGGASPAPAPYSAQGDPALAAQLESIADALEKCAIHLEGKAADA